MPYKRYTNGQNLQPGTPVKVRSRASLFKSEGSFPGSPSLVCGTTFSEYHIKEYGSLERTSGTLTYTYSCSTTRNIASHNWALQRKIPPNGILLRSTMSRPSPSPSSAADTEVFKKMDAYAWDDDHEFQVSFLLLP